MKNNNTWNMVDEMIFPSTQHIILKIVGFQMDPWPNFPNGFVVFDAFWQSGPKGKISSNLLKYSTFDGIF